VKWNKEKHENDKMQRVRSGPFSGQTHSTSQ